MIPKVVIAVREGVCPNGWTVQPHEGCASYTGGHMCDRDADHRGKCKCVCGATTGRKVPKDAW